MRSALLTTAGIFVLAAGCGESGEKKSGEEGREAVSATTSAEGSASPAKPARRALVFREPTLAGPAYVAASDQLLIIDTDGSVDVVSESLGIAQLEQLPTGELLLRSANGLDRVSGRAIKPITTSVPAAATEFSAAADDDVWAVGKRSVHHFDGKDWRITAVPGSQAEPHFRGVAVDATGVAWLAAGTDGLFAWDGSRWKKEEAVKGEVLHVAASAAGVHVVQPTGVVELKGGAVTDVVRRSGADVKAGDVAGDRSWMLFLGDAGGAISFSVGKGETQSWDGPLLRFTTESRWFTPDTRGRVWVTTKRNVIVAGKDVADTSIPLSAAVGGDLVAVEVIGSGPEKLPSEIGPSVSMPVPESSLPIPSGSAPRGNAIINADPGFADGVLPNASAVVAGMAAGFRRCYNRGLLENPNMKGSLRITAKVGPNGEVLSATASPNSGLSQSVVSCLTARVSSANFSKPNGGGATIVIPVSLLPQ